MGTQGRSLTIDTGKRSIAWAEFVDGPLVQCGLERSRKEPFESGFADMLSAIWTALGGPPSVVVIEVPRIYPRERRRDPNDLIDLSTTAGACATLGPPVFVHPAQWKGQTPKDISNKRTLKALTEEEMVCLETCFSRVPKSLQHNVLDAIGIGLWWRRK